MEKIGGKGKERGDGMKSGKKEGKKQVNFYTVATKYY